MLVLGILLLTAFAVDSADFSPSFGSLRAGLNYNVYFTGDTVEIGVDAGTKEGQLQLTYSQMNQELDVRCALKDSRKTNVSTPVSLVLSRIQNGTDQVLTSAAFMAGAAPITHDLKDAVVTSGISQDGSSESYVNVHWGIASSQLQGYYTCTLNGLDTDYSPLSESESRRLTLTGLQPVLQASPEVIDVGVTRFFNLRCSFADLALHNVSQIESIELIQINTNVYKLLATVTMFSEAAYKPPGNPHTAVTGSVGNSESYLDIVWEHPDHDHAGQYNCDILGLDSTGTPVHFSRTVGVRTVDPGRDVLIDKIHNLEASLDATQQNLAQLNASCENTTNELDSLKQDIDAFQAPNSCEGANLTVGQQVVKINPNRTKPDLMSVVCELTSTGEIWTVFQKRFNGSVDFYRTYEEYEDGFGDLDGEFWLGLKPMVRLMGDGKNELRVDMIDHQDTHHTRIYTTFELDPNDDYKLNVAGYQDNGNGMSYNNGYVFSTYDRNVKSCAKSDYGGWWYGGCTYANLNGKWGETGEPGISWNELPYTRTYPLKETEMKFRRKP